MYTAEMAEGIGLERRLVAGHIIERPYGMCGSVSTEKLERRFHFEVIDGAKIPVYIERPQSQWDLIDNYNKQRWGKSCCPPGRCCSSCSI